MHIFTSAAPFFLRIAQYMHCTDMRLKWRWSSSSELPAPSSRLSAVVVAVFWRWPVSVRYWNSFIKCAFQGLALISQLESSDFMMSMRATILLCIHCYIALSLTWVFLEFVYSYLLNHNLFALLLTLMRFGNLSCFVTRLLSSWNLVILFLSRQR